MISPAFRGHGTFCYLPDETMHRYRAYPSAAGTGRAQRFAQAARDMGMSHIWVRLFGLEGVMEAAPTKELVDAARAAGLAVAGWGYCHGAQPATDLARARAEADRHQITAFVADIEPGRLLGGTRARWEEAELGDFMDGLVAHFGRDNVGISTWPVLAIQNEPAFPSKKLMQAVADRVAMFAPQAYWMIYPKPVHYAATGFKEADYPRNDPASFVRLVVDAWRADGLQNPLVVTGQAYWGEGAPAPDVLAAKIRAFSAAFNAWPRIAGFNWWHAGGPKAMSSHMIDALKIAQLGSRPFAHLGALEAAQIATG